MNKLIIEKTTKSDIPAIVSMEGKSENSQYIIPNTEKVHFDLLANEDIEHLVFKTEQDAMIGSVILADPLE